MILTNALRAFALLLAALASTKPAYAQGSGSQADAAGNDRLDVTGILEKVDQLVEQNQQLEKQNRQLERQNQALIEQVTSMRRLLVSQSSTPVQTGTVQAALPPLGTSNPADTESVQQPKTFGAYTPTVGFKVAETELGNVNFRFWGYTRYLNQLGLDDTYTDAFGNTKPVQNRQDLQFQKALVQFDGWLLNPKFRYLTYIWSSNASQGLGSQVVVAGNLSYAFNQRVTLAGGIGGLPGTRSLEGSSPFWLLSDNRPIADEFFRPSFTTGIWAKGKLAERLTYHLMIGNNMSQLGVDAGQLDNNFSTVSGALVWMPTTGEFGLRAGYGDFEGHRKVATRFGVHFTRSDENRTGQPNTEQFENTQLRLSDGNVIFTPRLFGPATVINDAEYKMTSFDAGIKYRGFSLEGEYYWRHLGNFRGPGTPGLPSLFDHGFQAQASSMIIPRSVQLYTGYSKIFGQYGKPWDFRAGLNWFPFKTPVVRWNNEWLYLYKSPVGNLGAPYPVGAKGTVVYTGLEVSF